MRRVKPGHEREFEAAIAEFFARAERSAATTGAYLLRPVPGGDPREYGVLRSFASAEAERQFYASPLYREWDERVAALVEGPARRRELHGLEAFFRDAAEGSEPPPAWKMALLTWVAVNPAVYLFARAVPAAFGELPGLVELLTVNVFVVASLTWVLMPLLTRLARPWLAGGERRGST